MLQDNSVLNLQHESDNIRIAQQVRAEPILYTESNIITAPPRHEHTRITNDVDNRRELPVSTVEFGDGRSTSTYMPQTGLDHLYGLSAIHIEQTYELHEYSVASENRYTVRAPSNEALFGASESSTPRSRMVWGSARPFVMHIFDKTRQEVLKIKRNLALGIFFCKPQYVEIWTPPGNLLGCVRETFSCFSDEFTIEKPNGDILYQIEGPPRIFCCTFPKEIHMKIFSADFRSEKGSISRIWNPETSIYTLTVNFNEPGLNVREKALFLGAAFLMEYMYFQNNCC